MKIFFLTPLIFLSACSTTPQITIQPRQSSATAADSVRYPETVRAYHFGRYVDPNDDLVMHEQHTAYRVEENTRWNLRPSPLATIGGTTTALAPRDSAFSPTPVNDAVLAEVNAQRLATTQIMVQSQILSSALAQFETALAQTKTNLQETVALRAIVNDIKHRLDALEAAPAPSPASPISTTNKPPEALSP